MSEPARGEPVMQLEAHDHEQLEIEVRHGRGSAMRDGKHELELYMFIARNIGLNGANYPAGEFYGDLTSYLRVDVPELTLDDLRVLAHSPLRGIDRYLAELATGNTTPARIRVAVMLFGHEVTEALHAEHARLLAMTRDVIVSTDTGGEDLQARATALEGGIRRFAEEASAALGTLRSAKQKFSVYRRVAPRVWQVTLQTDEYASLRLDGVLASLAGELAAPSCAALEWATRVTSVLTEYAASEAKYRREQGYVNFDPDRAGSGEYLLYRQSLLKKAVQQALWVETVSRRADNYVRNAAGMTAASLAAVWALIAQLPQQLTSMPPALQTAAIALPVVAYVAKDRIKELTKEWLMRRMRAFDRETSLGNSQLAQAGLSSLQGTLREKVRFVDPDSPPRDVLELRRRVRWIAGAEVSGETLLVYRRLLETTAPERPAADGLDDNGRLALRQIIRLNLRHFMTRLDERDQVVRHFDPESRTFASQQIARVYHINVITRLVSSGQDTPQLQRWRIVLSKERIERIEEPR